MNINGKNKYVHFASKVNIVVTFWLNVEMDRIKYKHTITEANFTNYPTNRRKIEINCHVRTVNILEIGFMWK